MEYPLADRRALVEAFTLVAMAILEERSGAAILGEEATNERNVRDANE